MSKNKKTKSSPNISKTCIFYKHKNGFGGVAIEEATKINIPINEAHENFALDNDIVEVYAQKKKNNEWHGNIIRIIKHNTINLIGTIIQYKDKKILQVSNPKFGNYVVLLKSIPENFRHDELFNTIIVAYPDINNPFFTVQILNSIGILGEDKAFITQTILEANLPTEFSEKAMEQAKKPRDKILVRDIKSREDLREIPFVTIDGEDAKDFDDAVYCNYENNLYTLYVAIADVAHFVTHESPLDIEAYERGTSVYFPRQVIPMLPERLSNELCSLNPNKDRLVMCCKIEIDTNGNVLKYQLSNAIIKSVARLTYNQVHTWINNINLTPPEIFSNMSSLYLVYKALLSSRATRGAIDFDTTEPYFTFGEDGEVNGIQPRIRLESHKLIEECMLVANVCVADFMIKNTQPCLFRIHEKPSEDKFNNLKAYLNSLAIEFNVAYAQLTPSNYSDLLISVKNHPQFQAIQQTVLRSMQLAMYSPNNIGHFGLSYDKYLHFTSPIRRYPDLLTHRAIKKVLQKSKYEYCRPIEQIGEQTSNNERRAEELERKIDSFYKCKYAKSHIGSNFKGNLTSITNFGLFVFIPDLMLDGLVHITELGNDYFVFDDKKQTLTGKKTGIQYRNGSDLQIEIVGVDLAKLFIDLALYTARN
ncbi:MAG: ribonuclease R [Burkholderiales bacterium]|nr:ribonuclease R [Burkholderiales bacterium]